MRTLTLFASLTAGRFGTVKIMSLSATAATAGAKNGITSPTRRFTATAPNGRSTGICWPSSTLIRTCECWRYRSSVSRRAQRVIGGDDANELVGEERFGSPHVCDHAFSRALDPRGPHAWCALREGQYWWHQR